MDPLSIAAALSLVLGSTYFKQRSLSQQSSRVNDLAQMERARQNSFDSSRMGAINAALPGFSSNAQKATQESIAQKYGALFRGAQDAAPASNIYAGQNPSAPQEVKDAAAASMSAATAKGKDYADRLADLSAYGMLNFQSGVAQQRLGEKVAEATTSSRNSSNIFQNEVGAVPLYTGRRDGLLSDISSGMANIVALSGSKGAPAPDGGVGKGTGSIVDPFSGSSYKA